MQFFNLPNSGINKWWMYPIVVLVTFVGYNLGMVPLFIAVMRTLDSDPSLNHITLESFLSNPNWSTIGISNNIGLLLMLLIFVFAFASFYFIFILLHKRAFTSLISSKRKFNWKKIFFAFTLWFVLGCLAEYISFYFTPDHYTFHFNARKFAVLFIIAITLLPIQTSMEEFLFRGYLMQGIGSAISRPIIPLLITSLLFGLIHSSNPEVEAYGLLQMQCYYVSAGIFLGLITLLDESLDLALGVHAATNIFGALILSYEGGALQTNSLFKTSVLDPMFATILFIVTAIIFVFICYKKYDWPSLFVLFSKSETVSTV